MEYHATPEASICWAPKIAVWFGESLDYGDQIGGTPGNPLTVSDTRLALSENGSFISTSFDSSAFCNYGNGAPFFCDITGTRSFNVWTNR